MNDKNNEMLESVLSTPEIEFYERSDGRNPKMESSRKRPDSGIEHLNTKHSKKKRKETTKDRLLKLNEFYSNVDFGIWIQCIKCNKWRQSFDFEEEHQVPKDWFCSMNMTGVKNCDDPEKTKDVEFSETNFIPGSIVWAKLDGFPWWPGMVEDDPDTEEYYWFDESGKMFYNITFLDEDVTHAWVNASFVLSYLKPLPRNHKLKRNYKNAHLIEDAKEKANAAMKMSIKERLQTFSFAQRFKGKWSRAIDFDDEEESENLTKQLIKEIEDMDFLMSSDSEFEINSLAENQENISPKISYKENDLSKGKRKVINVSSPKKENFNEVFENVILNEEYFESNQNPKEKTFTGESNEEISVGETFIRNTPSNGTTLEIDKNEQQILHSLKTKKKTSAKLKSNSGNKLQKVSEPKTEGSNKEINKKKKSSGLGKSKKKGSSDNKESVAAEESKEVLNKFSKIVKKPSFTPPVRNETENHKNKTNSKEPSNQVSIDNRKISIANKPFESVEELISDEDESKSEKSSETEKDNNDGKEKEANSQENKNACLSNKLGNETLIKSDVVAPIKNDRELICISDEEPIGLDLLKANIVSKDVLKNATQNKTDEKISSQNIIAKGTTDVKGKYKKDKLAKKENVILKILEKNIKNSSVNAPNSCSDENNLDPKENSEIKNFDTEKDTIEKNKKHSNKAKKTSDIRDKRDQEKDKTSDDKKLENHSKANKKSKKTGKEIRAVMRVTKSTQHCPIKLNPHKKHINDVPNSKTSYKPPIMKNDITREQNYSENDDAVIKYEDVDNKSSKIAKKNEQSTKMLSSNCKNEISSYSLSLDDLKEQSEDEDSDPFEAD